MKSETQTTLVPATVGQPFEGGFYGGKIRIGVAIFAIVWAPKAEGEIKGLWLDAYTSVPGATSCFDSMANTRAMADAGSPIAKWALGLEINGFNDWVIPARDVLELAYRNLKPSTTENYCSFRDGDNPSSMPAGFPYIEDDPLQTTVADFQKGGAEAFDETWYWSSTQYSEGTAWGQDFSSGDSRNANKGIKGRARAVRMVPL